MNKEWFIVKTSKSVLNNVPFNETEYLFLELSTVEGHNKFYWTYSEVSPYNPKFKNVNMRYETRPHFMFSRLHGQNIMHNLHDDALGLFFTMKEYASALGNTMSFDKNYRIMLMDEFEQTETSRHFSYFTDYPLRSRRYFESSDIITCFKDAVLGNNKLATFYQYGFYTPQGKIQNKTLNGMYVREVATMMYRRLGIPDAFDENELQVPTKIPKSELFGTKLSELDLKETDLIIIFVRKGNRLILNESELQEALKKKYGLEVISLSNEEHSFEEQIRYMRRARVVAGMHGSILFMAMFCRRGTVLVEFFPFAVPSKNYTPYKTLAELPGMELVYRAWENKYEDASIGYTDRNPLHGGIDHLSKEERDKVLSTKTVPEHLCCSNPYWLYRIYQDTRVNIKEVLNIIDDGLQFSRQNILQHLHKANYFESSFIKPAQVNTGNCLNNTRKKPDELWFSWYAIQCM
jgi:protein O-mannose beta-1,4-N-acetylglucosaminyltransferase